MFAYLKNSPHLPETLKALASSSLRTLVYAPALPPEIKQQFRGRTFAFTERRVDLSRAAAECDIAVLNATHGAIRRAGNTKADRFAHVVHEITGRILR